VLRSSCRTALVQITQSLPRCGDSITAHRAALAAVGVSRAVVARALGLRDEAATTRLAEERGAQAFLSSRTCSQPHRTDHLDAAVRAARQSAFTHTVLKVDALLRTYILQSRAWTTSAPARHLSRRRWCVSAALVSALVVLVHWFAARVIEAIQTHRYT
jgi:hypothetical protein